jgi:hypothetical protein
MPYAMTDRGLQMSVRLYRQPGTSEAWFVLNGHFAVQESASLALVLSPMKGNWKRVGCVELSPNALRLLRESAKPELTTVYIKVSFRYWRLVETTRNLFNEISAGNHEGKYWSTEVQSEVAHPGS